MIENRDIKMDKIFNMRELGGLTTNDNRMVKHGLIYRSSRLSSASEDDIKKLQSFKIERVFDYRSYEEALHDADPSINDMIIYIVPALKADLMDTDVANTQAFFQKYGSEALTNFYQLGLKMYASLPFDNLAYKMVFNAMKDKQAIPFLHHCTAGRDRTGLASALILKLLDVNEDEIMADYLLSNEKLKDFYYIMLDPYVKDDNVKQQVIDAINLKPDYLQAAYKSILEKYQSFDEYFLQEYGIDEKLKKQIQANYLEPK